MDNKHILSDHGLSRVVSLVSVGHSLDLSNFIADLISIIHEKNVFISPIDSSTCCITASWWVCVFKGWTRQPAMDMCGFKTILERAIKDYLTSCSS